MLPVENVIQLNVHDRCHCFLASVRIDRGKQAGGYLNMISHFQRLVGDCRADAGWIVSRYGWIQTRTLTGRERRAEGESLNVLGWVSPIAGGLRVVGVVQAQGNVPTVTFLLMSHLPAITPGQTSSSSEIPQCARHLPKESVMRKRMSRIAPFGRICCRRRDTETEASWIR